MTQIWVVPFVLQKNMSLIEQVSHKFNIEDLIKAQNKTKEVVLSFSKKIHKGMSEKEGHQLLEKMLDDSGLEKRWHPTKFRLNKNTIKSFKENSDEVIANSNDLFFIDIGPVYFNHEGDYGETFVLGDNEEDKLLAHSAKEIFEIVSQVWKLEKKSGEELYQMASHEAMKRGYLLNTKMYGHRIGDFPHALYSRESLGNLNFPPTPSLWVLEIHIIDEKRNRGAFFEDILF